MSVAGKPNQPLWDVSMRLVNKPSPWSYISTLYFAQGVPNTVINTVSPILYKNLGIGNAQITFWTSFLNLPWVLKMFWAPIIDTVSTKRTWILTMQLAMFACMALIALSLGLPSFFFISLSLLAIAAFISATCDIATDGYYMLALSEREQAFFVGFRSLFFRIAMLFGSGFLVFLAGRLEKYLANIQLAWTCIFGFTAVLFVLLFVYHKLVLPKPEAGIQKITTSNDPAFWQVIRTYFHKPKIAAILAFILTYRLGEAMLVKLASLFLLDPIAKGGLGLSTETVGLVYGTFGVISLICGGILGGLLISRYGLRKCLFPMALALNFPNIFYVYMAYAKPGLTLVYPLVSLEQFGYGLGFTAFTVYLLQICDGEYKTSHYAISTGLMALGLMLPGAISGQIQTAIGYTQFFIVVCLFTIPGMIAIFFLPMKE